LAYIRELQRQLDLSVILVHHTRKNAAGGIAAGQGLRGSSDLHAFGDSNLYLRLYASGRTGLGVGRNVVRRTNSL
jgi:RecA-family ATPase